MKLYKDPYGHRWLTLRGRDYPFSLRAWVGCAWLWIRWIYREMVTNSGRRDDDPRGLCHHHERRTIDEQ